jgi:hypothetical protein
MSNTGTDIIQADGEDGGSTCLIKGSGRRATVDGQEIKTKEQLTSEPHAVSLNLKSDLVSLLLEPSDQHKAKPADGQN